MWNLSAAIIIPVQRGHETFCLVQPSPDHFVLGILAVGWGCLGHVLCKIMFFPLFDSSLSCSYSSFSSKNCKWGGRLRRVLLEVSFPATRYPSSPAMQRRQRMVSLARNPMQPHRPASEFLPSKL